MILGAVILSLLVFFLTNRRYRWFYIIYKTFWRDLCGGYRFLRLNILLHKFARQKITVPKLFTQVVDKHPDKIAISFENQTWTFQQLDEFSNQIAHYFKSKGYHRGDTVALLLENKPEYIGIWLGLSKIGVVTSLINHNLVSLPLLHTLKICEAKGLIYDTQFQNVIKDIRDKLEVEDLLEFNAKDNLLEGSLHLSRHLDFQPKTRLIHDLEQGIPKERILFVYTSGTTGLPKAAVITHSRFFMMTFGIGFMADMNEDDILYGSLPLYHSSGGIVAVGHCLLRGGQLVIRKKFSASAFWSDCIKYNCTVAQYIGETCRFILAAHAKDNSVIKHKIRLMFGNGLRPQLWRKFVERFQIPKICEFYGSTEGNSNIINIDNKIGAVGFVPRYAKYFHPVTLIRCNENTGEPIRYSNGFCKRCNPGEVGVFIGNIKTNNSVNAFQGYADKRDTEKKIITNVFVKGDAYFNSGDILVQDEFGYYYFKDRTGDTFRWKGENVATSEIEALISNFTNLTDAIVFGVEVPGNEGRAGMVAIVDTKNSLSLTDLAFKLKTNLPTYAIPLFVRVMESVPMTGTYKLKKNDLQADGYNMDKVKDKLFIYDQKNVTYIELTREKYEEIQSGQVRL